MDPKELLLKQLKSGNDIITLKLNENMEPDENGEIELFGTLSELRILYQLTQLTLDSGGGYSIPTDLYQYECRYQPQITLLLRQLTKDVKSGTMPGAKPKPILQSRISYRLSKEVTTETEIKTIANNILSKFKDFSFLRGPVKCIYDEQSVLVSNCLVTTESEGERVFRAILGHLQKQFKKDCFSFKKFTPKTHQKKIITGLERLSPEDSDLGREGKVIFAGAELHIHGLKSLKLCNGKKVAAQGDKLFTP